MDTDLKSFRLLMEYYSFLCWSCKIWIFRIYYTVSVSLRSIIHSYFWNIRIQYIWKRVSVSLQSIIHSYKKRNRWFLMEKKYLGFRLLTEYHSFLCKVYSLETIRLGKCVSVSSRSIIHSYKLVKNSAFGGYYLAFPSPYGVLFILMEK